MKCIAIDGPSGSGKSTVAKMLAEKLHFTDVNTGALYRAIAYYLKLNNIDYNKVEEVKKVLDLIEIEIKDNKGTKRIILNGIDVSDEIRMEEISLISSKISSYGSVRDHLLKTQRDIARKNNVVMDGRDIGTVVMPNADVKIFLTAAPEVRARRRYEQLKDEHTDFETVLKDLNERDYKDIHRKIAPLRVAKDAIVFDNSNYTVESTVEHILNIIRENIDE